MFRGQSLHNLDSKGRLRLPVRFRDALKDDFKDDSQVVITTWDKCLIAYPVPIWRQIEEKVMSLPTIDPRVREFMRYFISGAQSCPFDKQGRILIPQYMRQFAKLDKEVLLAGMLKSFEIWNKDRWDEEMERTRPAMSDISEKMAEFGI